MRRLAPLVALAFLLAGCGGQETISPTASKVEGQVPTTATTTQAAAKGNPQAGSKVFASQGCGGCHTFKPAGTNGTIGPDLDKLPEYAKTANMPLADFAHESIVSPSSYVEKGYPNSMPDFGSTLSDTQVADLVAYLTSKQG